jgi:uncharacterized membrane-anchored protein
VVGTTTSDYFDRTLGLGYVKSSIFLSCAVIAVLVAWHYSTGVIAVDRVSTRKNEIFYWMTILVSNTLGTALGDFVGTTTGVGFEGGALVTKAHTVGGLGLSRVICSLVLPAAMVVIVALTSRRERGPAA